MQVAGLSPRRASRVRGSARGTSGLQIAAEAASPRALPKIGWSGRPPGDVVTRRATKRAQGTKRGGRPWNILQSTWAEGNRRYACGTELGWWWRSAGYEPIA